MKGACILHLILIGILSVLILSVKNRGWVGGVGFLNRQNPLSVTKVICRQYLDRNYFDWLYQVFFQFPGYRI